ncbi:hypothetical protein [Hoeflea ulvae]|uniref:BON domain-containing protein n=1 Tax=Hoeflea ulvae TaxID=2983764 RepID=A0ABT3YLZ3_9HYPH|nr:hypothetical protein [Hoeflea ulvae]MCY0096852.1 hypothetical protein [Hoeflea ulvae]
MTRELCKTLAAGCGAIAIMATMGTAAQAFDEVNWIWNADVVTTVETSTTVTTELEPTGLNQAENEQEMRGTISSGSTIDEFGSLPDLAVLDPVVPSDTTMIESDAQSMGNSASINSAVQINYDSSQIFAGLDPDTAGSVNADSSVTNVTNAMVDTSAMAVANSLTVNLDYVTTDDAIAIGNNVQSTLADVSAMSSAETVSITGLSLLSGSESQSVKSAATAVGNNFSVDVQQAEGPVVDPVVPLLP